jgi:hypothetical protein
MHDRDCNLYNGRLFCSLPPSRLLPLLIASSVRTRSTEDQSIYGLF